MWVDGASLYYCTFASLGIMTVDPPEVPVVCFNGGRSVTERNEFIANNNESNLYYAEMDIL